MNPVESYIYHHLEGEEREIASYLHDLLTQRYGMTYKLRYKIPFYDVKKWLCYINPQKKRTRKIKKASSKSPEDASSMFVNDVAASKQYIGGGIELCFLHGRWMKDPQGALDAKDRVQIYGITYFTLEEIDEEVLQVLIEEAIEIDEKFSLLKKLPK